MTNNTYTGIGMACVRDFSVKISLSVNKHVTIIIIIIIIKL